MCATDFRCTGGITDCKGCNGFGYLTAGGRKYRRRSGARNLVVSTTKVAHEDCNGSGLAVCGCEPVPPATVQEITGRALEEVR